MRTLALGVLTIVSFGFATAQDTIRQFDFKNFTYPVNGPLLGHDRLQWLTVPDKTNPKRWTRLVNGNDLTKDSSFVMQGQEYTQWSGFKLESVEFADVTGEHKEEALVVLRYLTGGKQTTHYVYIYSFEDGKPKLLAYCHTGDRADYGLYKVYGEGGALVFELFDPNKRSGDCCSSGFVRIRYRWRASRFEAFGTREYGTTE